MSEPHESKTPNSSKLPDESVAAREPVAPADSPSSFEQASREQDPGLAAEFLDFLLHNKKWWLIPILVVTLLLTALTFLAASPVAPFIYTLF